MNKSKVVRNIVTVSIGRELMSEITALREDLNPKPTLRSIVEWLLRKGLDRHGEMDRKAEGRRGRSRRDDAGDDRVCLDQQTGTGSD